MPDWLPSPQLHRRVFQVQRRNMCLQNSFKLRRPDLKHSQDTSAPLQGRASLYKASCLKRVSIFQEFGLRVGCGSAPVDVGSEIVSGHGSVCQGRHRRTPWP